MAIRSCRRLVCRKAGRERGPTVGDPTKVAGFRPWSTSSELFSNRKSERSTTIACRRATRFKTFSASLKFVPRFFGLKKRISRMTRNTCRRALFRRNIFLHLVGKKNQSNLVIIADRRKRQHRRNLRRKSRASTAHPNRTTPIRSNPPTTSTSTRALPRTS